MIKTIKKQKIKAKHLCCKTKTERENRCIDVSVFKLEQFLCDLSTNYHLASVSHLQPTPLCNMLKWLKHILGLFFNWGNFSDCKKINSFLQIRSRQHSPNWRITYIWYKRVTLDMKVYIIIKHWFKWLYCIYLLLEKVYFASWS